MEVLSIRKKSKERTNFQIDMGRNSIWFQKTHTSPVFEMFTWALNITFLRTSRSARVRIVILKILFPLNYFLQLTSHTVTMNVQ